MIRYLPLPLGVLLLAFAAPATAQPASADPVLISRGDAALTLSDLDGRMQRFSDVERAIYARDASNLARLMDRLLLFRQLATEARAMGLDKDPKVIRDLQLAQEEVLATHRMNQLTLPQNMPDFEPLARERYLADPAKFSVPAGRKVVHLLIGTEERTDEEALALAVELRDRALAGEDFAALVMAHSEDPGKDSNAGEYTIRADGEFVPEFEQAARALPEPGAISEPVKTRFGYHLIKLLELQEASVPDFEDVKPTLIEELRSTWLAEARDRHTDTLRQLEDTGNEELLMTLPARYGGRPEEVAAPPAGSR
jgi:peptidyl-prolyl cis-trans isomerase C